MHFLYEIVYQYKSCDSNACLSVRSQDKHRTRGILHPLVCETIELSSFERVSGIYGKLC